MPINQFFASQAPTAAQTPTGAGMSTFGQGIQNSYLAPLLRQQLQNSTITNQYLPQTLSSQIFENRMFPMAILGQSPNMWLSKNFPQMYGQGIYNNLMNAGLIKPGTPMPQFGLQSAVGNAASDVGNAANSVLQAVSHPESLLQKGAQYFAPFAQGGASQNNSENTGPGNGIMPTQQPLTQAQLQAQTGMKQPYGNLGSIPPTTYPNQPTTSSAQNVSSSQLQQYAQQNGINQAQPMKNNPGWYVGYVNGRPIKFPASSVR